MRTDASSLSIPSVIAIGDLHGYYPALERLLAAIDRRYKVFARKTLDQLVPDIKLVFTGDYIDRGDGALKIIERLKQLQRANRGSPQVITLFGNHELLALEAYDVACRLARELSARLVTKALDQYGAQTVHGYPGNGGQSFVREFGSTERSALKNYAERMNRNGDVGEWIRGLLPYYEATLGKRKVLFVHADLSEELLRSGALERYKQGLLRILRAPTRDMGGTARKYGHDWLMSSAGFFWNRSFRRLKGASSATVKEICDHAGVDFIVTGHTPQPPKITCYGGRIFDIDVGMSKRFWKSPDRENVPWALLLWRSGRVAGFSANGEEQEFRARVGSSNVRAQGSQLELFVEE